MVYRESRGLLVFAQPPLPKFVSLVLFGFSHTPHWRILDDELGGRLGVAMPFSDPSLNESEAETLSDTLSDPRAEPHSLQPGEPSGC